MSVKTVYTCDKCGRELEEHYDYINLAIDLDCGSVHKCDLCGDCYHDLCETVKLFLSSRAVPKCSCDNSKDSSCCDHLESSEIQNKCQCYDNGRCNGTLERDRCSCDGNELNCSFYNYVKVRGAEKYYNSLPLKYKCPYWAAIRERRINGAQYETCNNSMENDTVGCHGDKRLCQFMGIKNSTNNFADKVKEFIK